MSRVDPDDEFVKQAERNLALVGGPEAYTSKGAYAEALRGEAAHLRHEAGKGPISACPYCTPGKWTRR